MSETSKMVLFFIFMPIVYEILTVVLSFFTRECHTSYDKKEHIKEHAITLGISLAFDYVIELVWVLIVKHRISVWMFSEEFTKIDGASSAFDLFKYLAIAYIVLSLTFGTIIGSAMDEDRDMPILHTIILILFFILFATAIGPRAVSANIDEAAYEKMPYEQTVQTIDLKAMTDTHTTTGQMNGRMSLGSGYISGEIKDNYEVYYSYLDKNNGETVVDHFTYHNDTVDIFEEGPDCKPVLEITTHHKEYKTKYNEYSDTYYTYVVRVPSMVEGVDMDME